MCGAGRAGHMCESGWSDGESFRTSREPLSSEVEHISMVTDHGELLFCCSPSLRARRRCASRLRGGISSANVTVAAQQTQQLCLIALAFKVKQTADLHFDHSGLIYEFISVVWQVKYYMCCNQSWLPLCLCTKIHLHFHLSRLKQTEHKQRSETDTDMIPLSLSVENVSCSPSIFCIAHAHLLANAGWAIN